MKQLKSEDVQKMDTTCLYQIGEKKSANLKKLNIHTVYDLLHHYPFRYEDRRKICKIKDATKEEGVCIRGRILRVEKQLVKKNRILIKIIIQDETGVAELTMFNQAFLLDNLKVGRVLTAYGKAQEMYGRIQMTSPELDFDHNKRKTGFIYPVYPLTKGLFNDELIRWQRENLSLLVEEDYLDLRYRKKYQLCSLKEALHNIHFPADGSSLRIAKYRLIWDELFLLHLGLFHMKYRLSHQRGYAFEQKAEVEILKRSLNFELTVAQERVLKEIAQDMASKTPMQRLVQGDVGCGKTIVAFLCIANVFWNGCQSVLMVPTEILAKQHFEGAMDLFQDIPIQIRLLTGSTPKKQKEAIYSDLLSGACDLLIGTHAVLEEKVQFRQLGLVITDEQHRFGVRQRTRLIQRSQRTPDMLVMTATPIPRSMALILHGDLDISLIDELPIGRKSVQTRSVLRNRSAVVYDFAISEIDKGRQIYIVCPLIEESEKLDIQAAMNLYQRLKEEVFSTYPIALLHGKMKARQKQEIMDAFAKGQIDVLVSTTVIEVGINVPNATVMIIEDAQRFGLSQLHQLRGRVGRGSEQSYCFLIYEGRGDATSERMKMMCRSNDGFEISEKDLELRGPGEFLGTRQHGLLNFKLADIVKHRQIVEVSRQLAKEILNEDPLLQAKVHQRLQEEVKRRFNQGEEIGVS